MWRRIKVWLDSGYKLSHIYQHPDMHPHAYTTNKRPDDQPRPTYFRARILPKCGAKACSRVFAMTLFVLFCVNVGIEVKDTRVETLATKMCKFCLIIALFEWLITKVHDLQMVRGACLRVFCFGCFLIFYDYLVWLSRMACTLKHRFIICVLGDMYLAVIVQLGVQWVGREVVGTLYHPYLFQTRLFTDFSRLFWLSTKEIFGWRTRRQILLAWLR